MYRLPSILSIASCLAASTLAIGQELETTVVKDISSTWATAIADFDFTMLESIDEPTTSGSSLRYTYVEDMPATAPSSGSKQQASSGQPQAEFARIDFEQIFQYDNVDQSKLDHPVVDVAKKLSPADQVLNPSDSHSAASDQFASDQFTSVHFISEPSDRTLTASAQTTSAQTTSEQTTSEKQAATVALSMATMPIAGASPAAAVPTTAVSTTAVPTTAVPTTAVSTPAVPTPVVPTPVVPTPAVSEEPLYAEPELVEQVDPPLMNYCEHCTTHCEHCATHWDEGFTPYVQGNAHCDHCDSAPPCGCNHKGSGGLCGDVKHWWKTSDIHRHHIANLGHPALFCERPFGVCNEGFYAAMIAAGKADRAVLHHYDFAHLADGTVELTTRGQLELRRIARLMMDYSVPLLVASTDDPNLDAGRRLAVVDAVARLGLPISPDSIHVAKDPTIGLSGVDAQAIQRIRVNEIITGASRTLPYSNSSRATLVPYASPAGSGGGGGSKR